jgi:hypothetical protein
MSFLPKSLAVPGAQPFGNSLLDGLQLSYPMQELGGLTLVDSMWSAPGTYHGSNPARASGPFGNYSVVMDGSSNYITVPYLAKTVPVTALGGTEHSFSWVIWVYWNGSLSESYSVLMETSASSTVGVTLFLKSDGTIAIYFNAGHADPVSSDVFPTKQWSMISFLVHWDGSSVDSGEVWMGDKLIYTFSGGDSWGDTGPLLIGGHSTFGSGRYFNGRIGPISVWNRKITAREVTKLYNDPMALYQQNRTIVGPPPVVVPINEVLTDSFTLSDSITELIQVPQIAFSENLTFSDAVGVTANDFITFTDSLTLGDSVSFIAGIPLVLGDSIALSDSVQELLITVIFVALNDTLSLSDSEQVANRIPRAVINDFILFTDKIAVLANQQLTLSDQLAMGDLVQLLLAPIANLTLNDSFTLSDAVSTNLQSIFQNLTVSVSDTLFLQDAVGIALSQALLSFSDSLTFSDSVKVVLESTLNSYIRRYLNDIV